jgi:hypothetical protein
MKFLTKKSRAGQLVGTRHLGTSVEHVVKLSATKKLRLLVQTDIVTIKIKTAGRNSRCFNTWENKAAPTFLICVLQ